MPEMLYVFRVYRIKSGPAKLMATIRAPDAKTAVKVTAVKLRVRPESVKRLAAFRVYPEIEQRPGS